MGPSGSGWARVRAKLWIPMEDLADGYLTHPEWLSRYRHGRSSPRSSNEIQAGPLGHSPQPTAHSRPTIHNSMTVHVAVHSTHDCADTSWCLLVQVLACPKLSTVLLRAPAASYFHSLLSAQRSSSRRDSPGMRYEATGTDASRMQDKPRLALSVASLSMTHTTRAQRRDTCSTAERNNLSRNAEKQETLDVAQTEQTRRRDALARQCQPH